MRRCVEAPGAGPGLALPLKGGLLSSGVGWWLDWEELAKGPAFRQHWYNQQVLDIY